MQGHQLGARGEGSNELKYVIIFKHISYFFVYEIFWYDRQTSYLVYVFSKSFSTIKCAFKVCSFHFNLNGYWAMAVLPILRNSTSVLLPHKIFTQCHPYIDGNWTWNTFISKYFINIKHKIKRSCPVLT